MVRIKLWGGRFSKTADAQTDGFHASIGFDKRLCAYDIKGSAAHARMLGRRGIIGADEAALIEKTLLEILSDIENGVFAFDEAAEDIHMNIEAALIARIGEAGRKLHTARSRNDQVALDTRMYIKVEISQIKTLLLDLFDCLNEKAAAHVETVMPGYTHTQRAQPINLAHHLLAYCEMFKRDISRLDGAFERTDVCPLGSCALAGTTFDIDRAFTAEALGFSRVSQNSVDAVSDRDFLLDVLFCASVIMTHLSRFCEEIVLWVSAEFDFAELDDAYATGSSIMPQKKNPDMAELIRGKAGRVYGDLLALLTVV